MGLGHGLVLHEPPKYAPLPPAQFPGVDVVQVVPVQHAPVWEQTAQVWPSMNEPPVREQVVGSRLVTHSPPDLQHAPIPDWARASGAAASRKRMAVNAKRQQRARFGMGNDSGERANEEMSRGVCVIVGRRGERRVKKWWSFVSR